jgi:1-acyl-sn-glycerol-3-phosphate acyltransferase
MFTRRLLNAILRILFKICLRLDVVGRENIPAEGPVIFMINHVSFLDPIVVGGVSPREVVMMSKIENFSLPIWGIFIRLYGCFPVRRGEVDLQAIRHSLKALRDGEILLMAPEGTRSRTHQLQPGHDGMAFLALRANAPIMPVAVTGGQHFGSNMKRLRPTPFKVVFGKSFRLRSKPGRVKRKALRKMTEEAIYQLAAILPPEYRGVYSDLDSATERFLVFEGEG